MKYLVLNVVQLTLDKMHVVAVNAIDSIWASAVNAVVDYRERLLDKEEGVSS